MTADAAHSVFRLRFSIGSRTLLALALRVQRRDAFRRGGLAYVEETLERADAEGGGGREAFLFRSLEARPEDVRSWRRAAHRCEILLTYRRYRTDLSGTFDALLAGLSSRRRSTLLRKLRRFEARSGGRIDWRRYASAEQLRDFFDLALPLASRTYQARRFDGALPDDEAFVREALAQAE